MSVMLLLGLVQAAAKLMPAIGKAADALGDGVQAEDVRTLIDVALEVKNKVAEAGVQMGAELGNQELHDQAMVLRHQTDDALSKLLVQLKADAKR